MNRWYLIYSHFKQENKMLNCKPKHVNIVKYWYELGHDGYDCYGPESDLHDLYILIHSMCFL